MHREKKMVKIVILCHGNIMRSQVLGLYLRHHASRMEEDIEIFSAGVADWDAYSKTEILLDEVYRELKSREIDIKPERNVWSREVEEKINNADVVLAADISVKQDVISKMRNADGIVKIHTFYGFILEGNKDFEDTYDHIHKQQDPIRFKKAFSELDRIARKVIKRLEDGSFFYD